MPARGLLARPAVGSEQSVQGGPWIEAVLLEHCAAHSCDIIRVQSMTATHTEDIERTVAQIRQFEEAGCELARVTVPRAQALSNASTKPIIRVSLLLEDKAEEVRAAFDILQAAGRRVCQPEIITTPTRRSGR
ncbi:MAG: flavodoxin-dependent (E)-4-hydroxy-3-methylbut-2-enyl-diphosphate synthase [Planctomycetes bacterium]|nr:flavodoxin-dependent (E)-4-hydroxy-3-methylbut-2-enyl-diphosphate synthase [Planctomycetota bacterium]